MRTFIKNALGFICVMSLLLACGEGETLQAQIIWSASWLSVCVISGKLMTKLMTQEELEEKA